MKYFFYWNHRRNGFIEMSIFYLFLSSDIFFVEMICNWNIFKILFERLDTWEYTMSTWLTRVVAFLLTYCRVISKKARLELIKEASHVPQIEKPEEFNNIILNFLQPKSWLFFFFLLFCESWLCFVYSFKKWLCRIHYYFFVKLLLYIQVNNNYINNKIIYIIIFSKYFDAKKGKGPTFDYQ